jgi:GTPase SAR1 family protein
MEKWWPEVSHHGASAFKILVGTKSDLRGDSATVRYWIVDQFAAFWDDLLTLRRLYTQLEKLRARGQDVISQKQGRELAEKLGAIGYFETSGTPVLFDWRCTIGQNANGINMIVSLFRHSTSI